MPEIPFGGEVIKEMKSRPFTMITILALVVVVPYIWKTTASAEDLKELSASVTQINVTLVEAKLERINAQLFDIKTKIADKAAAHEPIDTIYTDKVKDLEADKAHTDRELAELAALKVKAQAAD